MDDLDFWKMWEVRASLAVLAFGAILAAVKWVERRNQARVDRTKDDLERDANSRVGALETQINSVAQQVDKVVAEVNDVERRVVGVERTLETVARTESVHELGVALARLEATTTSLGGKMDTLYRAAIEAGTQSK